MSKTHPAGSTKVVLIVIAGVLFFGMIIIAGIILAGAFFLTRNAKSNSDQYVINSASIVDDTNEAVVNYAPEEYLGFDIVTFRHDPTYYDETDEYVEIEWMGPGTVNMAGYQLVVTSAEQNEYTYTFPSVTLEAGDHITVYGQKGAGQFNFGASGEIWEDDYSSVDLYDPNEYLEAYYGY